MENQQRISAIAETLIQPSSGWVSLRLGELWDYRALLYFLVWRDIKVRYKQTVLGASWAILQPLMTMVVFTIFFGRVAQLGPEGIAYPIFSYAGLLPWTFFSLGLTQSSNSLVGSQNLLKKVYFPRLAIPIASALAPAVDFVLAFLILFPMMAYYGTRPTAMVIWLPFLALLAFASALGAGLWLSALNVQFRDIRYVIPFFTQLLLFVTPVIYSTAEVAPKLEEMGIPVWAYALNPMVGVVEGFRWALLGLDAPIFSLVLTSSITTLVLLVSGLLYFRRMEKTFADVV